MIDCEETWIEESPVRVFALRDYQINWKQRFNLARQTLTRMFGEGATGTGKTTFFASVAHDEVMAGGRVLIIENRDALIWQTAKRIEAETGIPVDIEKADAHASPHSQIVLASVQTLARINRITGFSDGHFTLIIVDEGHHSLANSYARVLAYFHWGAESLADEWIEPADGTYTPKATILSVTATPYISEKRSLSEFYQRFENRGGIFHYPYLNAVEDGWLVPPVTENIPLQINLKGARVGRTANGSDFKPEDLSARLIPVLEAIADQILERAKDRKSIAFVPSIECARILAAAITRRGMVGIFVSGECLDVDEKTDAYRAAGKGTVLVNACLYVEGADFPDCDCVIPARATKSISFYRQIIGRGTRVLPGVVDGLPTPALRRDAIAASAKPNLLILDFLWISDRIDLCDAFDVLTDKPEVKERMKASGQLTTESAREAERDFIKALEREAKKHARKAKRVVNPLSWSLSLGDAKLATWEPETDRDARPITPGQAEFLRRQHIDVEKIKYFGLASKVIGTLVTRLELGLASPSQLDFLHSLGLPDEQAATLKAGEASQLIDQLKKERGWR